MRKLFSFATGFVVIFLFGFFFVLQPAFAQCCDCLTKRDPATGQCDIGTNACSSCQYCPPGEGHCPPDEPPPQPTEPQNPNPTLPPGQAPTPPSTSTSCGQNNCPPPNCCSGNSCVACSSAGGPSYIYRTIRGGVTLLSNAADCAGVVAHNPANQAVSS